MIKDKNYALCINDKKSKIKFIFLGLTKVKNRGIIIKLSKRAAREQIEVKGREREFKTIHTLFT